MISSDRWPRQQASLTVAATGGAAHTKGSYADLITATSFHAELLEIALFDTNAVGTYQPHLVDIAIDPTGGTTRTVIIPNILAGGINAIGATVLAFPVSIPKGSRVSMRCQDSVGSATAVAMIRLRGGRNPSRGRVQRGQITDYGVTTATSSGVVLTNATANNKAAWVNLGTASRRHSGLVPAFQIANNGVATFNLSADIGIDPAGGSSYTVVLPDIRVRVTNNEQLIYTVGWAALMAIPIPAGATIGARSASSVSNTNLDVEAAVYAF